MFERKYLSPSHQSCTCQLLSSVTKQFHVQPDLAEHDPVSDHTSPSSKGSMSIPNRSHLAHHSVHFLVTLILKFALLVVSHAVRVNLKLPVSGLRPHKKCKVCECRLSQKCCRPSAVSILNIRASLGLPSSNLASCVVFCNTFACLVVLMVRAIHRTHFSHASSRSIPILPRRAQSVLPHSHPN